jgi:preprotein translocase subunit SecG
MTPLFAAVNWLEISINLLLVIHVIVCLLLALVVLMQRPKQEGLGAAFGSGLTDQAFGARTTDVLQKGTVYLGTLFFVITLVLAILIGKRQNTIPSMVDADADKTEQAATDAPAALPTEKSPVVMPEVEKTEKKTEKAATQTKSKTETKTEKPADVKKAEKPVEVKKPAEVEKVEKAVTPEKKEEAPAEKPEVNTEKKAPEAPAATESTEPVKPAKPVEPAKGGTQ